MLQPQKSGFTLIEILIVMAILAVLIVLIAGNFLTSLSRARDGQRKGDLKNIQTALRAYYNDAGRNPCNTASFQMRACSTATIDNCATVSACEWGQPWIVDSTTYMNELPDDPLSERSYRYTQVDDETYLLEACLENENDPQCAVGDEVWCSSMGGCVYQLRN